VTNLDFSQSALDVGRENARLNGLPVGAFECKKRGVSQPPREPLGLPAGAFECVCGDALPALRQLAGLPTNTDRRSRGGRGLLDAGNRPVTPAGTRCSAHTLTLSTQP